MTLHLKKLAVGATDLADMQAWVAEVGARHGAVVHVTRTRPRRAEAVLVGGSLYWIIKGTMAARQPILALDEVDDPETGAACAIVMAPRLVPVAPRPHRPFQGWRYLEAADAPADLAVDTAGVPLPPELAAELRDIGVL